MKPSRVYRKVVPSIEGVPSTPEKDVYSEGEDIEDMVEEDLEQVKHRDRVLGVDEVPRHTVCCR